MTLTESSLSAQELDLVNRSHKKIKRNANGDPVALETGSNHMETENALTENKRQQEKAA